MTTEGAASLPYHEPDIVTILVQASCLLALNVVSAVLDRLVYCGLLGQVLVGVTWGTPGAQWLSSHVEEVMVQLGYLGLLLLVYEGGLSTSFQSLRANLRLSSAVALTGIMVPIGLSFSLQGLLGATPLQAFAAGAALCSTSLGTTFTVLSSSGLTDTRLGVILSSAAMMDDVVGLVMVQVITNLGGGSIGAVTVVRPVLVSLAFAVVIPLAGRFVVNPATRSLNRYRDAHPAARVTKILKLPQAAFTIHTLWLIALVAGATYAGTSNLLAAYIAGATISWWDSEVPHPTTQTEAEQEGPVDRAGLTSGTATYSRYYQQVVSRVLQPFFFASIGFSIPITRMFRGRIVWRGIIYTILMTVGKLVCGLWLVRLSLAPGKDVLRGLLSKVNLPSVPHLWGRKGETGSAGTASGQVQSGVESTADTTPGDPARLISVQREASPPKPFSLHPPLILALAMTARGEIGFLISALAESNGVFSSATGRDMDGESDLFLVVTWAIVLCTIIGPLGVGLCVRRVKALEAQKNKSQEGAGRDVLGVWGVG